MRYKSIIGILVVSFIFAGVAMGDKKKYKIDKNHTRVGFAVKHMLISTVRGEYNEYSANLMIDDENITNSSLEGTIIAESIDTKNKDRDNHLRSEDFFYVEKYPKIKFKSKNIEKKDDGYTMTGDLTMRGITKEIEIPFTITGKVIDPMGNQRIGFEAEFKLNRKDFGINWNKTLDAGGLVVSDMITVEISGEAVRKK